MCWKRSSSLWLVLCLLPAPSSVRAQPSEPPKKAQGAEPTPAMPAPPQPAAAPETKPAAAEAAPRELTPREREIEEMLALEKAFEEQVREYKEEVQRVIERRYNEKQDGVGHSYERVLADLEREKDELRLEAIEVFERFLKKYPSEPTYTPRTLWRLAELHYEKSEMEYNQLQDAFQQQLADFQAGRLKVEPTEPAPHYERSIALLQRLVHEFPDYPLNDGALYLLGYCLKEQGEEAEAQASWMALLQRFPKSKLLPETWTRLGESYFWDPDKLDKAIDAYLRVLDYPDSPMYDKALYKLAWTYYRVDRFAEAVARFDQLIVWSDQAAGEGGEGELSRSDLRKEAMQYLAICFAEDGWEGGGVENAAAFLSRSGGRKYDGEFFKKLGEVYFLEAKYEKAVAAYREVIRRYPLDPKNPELLSTVIDALSRLQKFDDASLVEEEMTRSFGPGSPWREANKDNLEAVLTADRLAERALASSAYKHHILAQRFKKDNRAEEARQEYLKAAGAYQAYLKQFPDSKDAYNLRWYLAECLYYSQQFEQAAAAYTAVRDDPAGSEHTAEAANSVIQALQELIKAEEAAGKLAALTIPTSKEHPEDLSPRPLPELYQRLIAACDVYVQKLPADEQSENLSFTAAKVLYSHLHFDEARERFARIVSESKNDAVASSATNLIIESYLMTQDWAQVEVWSKKLAALTRDPQMKQSLKTFELGARFKRAGEMMEAGNKAKAQGDSAQASRHYEEAAAEFVRLVDDDPTGKNSDKALNNAALCFTWSNRPVSAGKIYERIIKEYPKSEFADQALFLMATSAEASYQFDRAIESYLKLVDNYKDSKFRADALYNAAINLEGDQQYERAARAYERYAQEFKDRPDAAENFFRAGVMLERAKEYRAAIALFERFSKAFSRDLMQRERLVEARMKIAEAYQAQGDARRARQGYQEVYDLFVKSKLPAGGRGAEAAAKARFLIAEDELKRYEAITFDVPERMLGKTLTAKATSLKAMEEKYKSVFALKRVQWTLAAYFRLGYLYENFADALINAPCPKGFNQEECDVYKGKLEEQAEAPIKKAVTAYKECMDKSREFKVVNSWIQKTLESLNRFDPLNFPLQKEADSALIMERYSPQPMVLQVEAGIKPAGK
ncbi:MAG: tetratricopeptide repeat protein [Myxococcales bacterium]|nr:tetratricopeptide repeat protein [Myxococcales bacterium]